MARHTYMRFQKRCFKEWRNLSGYWISRLFRDVIKAVAMEVQDGRFVERGG